MTWCPWPGPGAPVVLVTVDCIVLVKQVPDVSNIPEDAWDRDKGTLRRAMLDSILNPLDLHALTFAERLTQGDPDARTVFLSMGPPQARDVLVDCLSRVPGEAILLTDNAFAGADTGATAYSLASAIRRIAREMFDGRRDYAIVTGMQSVDGDTAQVPPQIAEELGIDHIAYAKGLETEPELRIRRIGPEGIEDVRPVRWPALVTVTACTDPLYRSFDAARRARTAPIHEWNAASVEADPKRIGLKGSWTQVYRLFSPSEDRPKTCEYIRDPAELIGKILDRYQHAAPGAEVGDEDGYELAGRTPTYRGEFWVFVEREGDGVRSVSLELLGKVRHLADSLDERVGAVLPCAEPGERPAQLIAAGADTVYVLQHPLLRSFDPLVHKKAIAALVADRKPQVMVFGASPLGRELAPRVAYACRSGLTADCTRLEIGDFTKGSLSLVGVLKQTRPALGGNVMATIMTKDSPTQMATVRPGVFKVPTPDGSRSGEVIQVPVELTPDDVGLDAVPVESFASKVSIRDAEIIVAGGHGFRSRKDFDTYLQPLAVGLGRLLGAKTKVAASRMAVEDGFTTHDYQVGQTGQTVQPRLYVAIGISGAVQHITGMQGSEIVVAVNKDPRARIFNYADFGVVGDIETVVPDLIRATEQRA
jgi:electron transfer flavoprotein alpha subunit